MPIVKTAERQLPTGYFKLQIKCDSGGHFTAKLPPQMFRILGINEVGADSLKACESAFNKAVQQFTDANTKKRKVICYKIQRKISFAEGLALAVAAGVFEETTIEGEGFKTPRKEYDWMKSTIPGAMLCDRYDFPDHAQKLEWTAEREEFFAMIGAGLTRVIDALATLTNGEDCARIADSGQFALLLTAGETKAGQDAQD